MDDLLPSASLILAVIALLFNTWKDEIQEARDLSISLHYIDSEKDHKKVKEALWRRSFPLALSATTMIIIFIPEIVWTINQSIDVIQSEGFSNSLNNYDAKAATFIFVFLLFIAFAYYLWSLTIELYKRHREFEEKRLEEEQQET
jgi:hypothetical protein